MTSLGRIVVSVSRAARALRLPEAVCQQLIDAGVLEAASSGGVYADTVQGLLDDRRGAALTRLRALGEHPEPSALRPVIAQLTR